MHPCQGSWVAVGHVRVDYALSAEIKCRNCTCGIKFQEFTLDTKKKLSHEIKQDHDAFIDIDECNKQL